MKHQDIMDGKVHNLIRASLGGSNNKTKAAQNNATLTPAE